MESAIPLTPITSTKVNIPEGPEYETNISSKSMCGEIFYQLYSAQQKLLRPLNNREKWIPKKTIDSILLGLHGNQWKTQQLLGFTAAVLLIHTDMILGT